MTNTSFSVDPGAWRDVLLEIRNVSQLALRLQSVARLLHAHTYRLDRRTHQDYRFIKSSNSCLQVEVSTSLSGTGCDKPSPPAVPLGYRPQENTDEYTSHTCSKFCIAACGGRATRAEIMPSLQLIVLGMGYLS